MATTVELGEIAKDTVSGMVGVLTKKASYLDGYRQCFLSPRLSAVGDCTGGHWFEEKRLEVLDVPKMDFDNEDTPGSDVPAPTN